MVSNTDKSPGQIFGRKRMVYPQVDDFGWRDITAPIELRGVAVTDPSWTQIGSTVFYAYAFGVDDIVWMNFHVPHDIVPNGQIFFHAHWFTNGTSTNSVKWQWDYTYAKGFNQGAFDFASPTTVTAEEAASGTAYQHMVTETVGQTVDGLTEPDGIIQVRLSRITNGGSENADTVFLTTSDIHYQSTNQSTYGKAPNFYTG